VIKSASSFFLLSLLSQLVLADDSTTRNAGPFGAETSIYMRVYNYAEAPEAVLGAAKAEAARIYRHSGVKLEWVDCPCSVEDVPDYPACQSLAGGPAVLQVKILPKSMAKRLGAPRLDFGLSMIPKDGGLAFNTSIFYHRVEAIAKKGGLSRAVILGHILAHEIGHLLLGRGSHSGSGIMHVPWDKLQLRRASEGRLLFTSPQAKQIRDQVLRRYRG
jgi:hypothetical protein